MKEIAFLKYLVLHQSIVMFAWLIALGEANPAFMYGRKSRRFFFLWLEDLFAMVVNIFERNYSILQWFLPRQEWRWKGAMNCVVPYQHLHRRRSRQKRRIKYVFTPCAVKRSSRVVLQQWPDVPSKWLGFCKIVFTPWRVGWIFSLPTYSTFLPWLYSLLTSVGKILHRNNTLKSAAVALIFKQQIAW